MSRKYGRDISPVLKEIHDALWEIDSRDIREPYDFAPEALPSAAKIFMAVCMDELWLKQEANETPFEDRLMQAENMGNNLREFMEKHLDVDSTKFYTKS